jgi:hypothetical protein
MEASLPSAERGRRLRHAFDREGGRDARDARTDDTEGRHARRADRHDEQPPSSAAANGYRGGYVLKADEGDDVVVTVMHDGKDAYFAMVHDPQTGENFGTIVELLEGGPRWTDGEWLGPEGVTRRRFQPRPRLRATALG